jgi:hypothetical protein
MINTQNMTFLDMACWARDNEQTDGVVGGKDLRNYSPSRLLNKGKRY